MLYAIKDGERIEARKGVSANCPCCGEPVVAKCGKIYVWHWAHKKKSDCSDWYEPETQWHKDWKNQFPIECQEVVVTNPEKGKRHIADVRLPNGLVIEFQNSPISSDTIEQRELFYDEMIWVINADKFRDNLNMWHGNNLKWNHPRRSWIFSTKPKFLDFPNTFPRTKQDIHFAKMYPKMASQIKYEQEQQARKLVWIKNYYPGTDFKHYQYVYKWAFIKKYQAYAITATNP